MTLHEKVILPMHMVKSKNDPNLNRSSKETQNIDSGLKNVVVKKYGGTSVANVERIRNVADRVKRDQARGETPLVVVSAMAGETNKLVKLAGDVLPTHRGPAYDMLLASGEQVSIALLSMAFESVGIRAKPYLAHQLDIRTDSMHSRARIVQIDSSKLIADLKE